MDFVIDNLGWFIFGGVIILMALIGYFAEKTDFGKKSIEPKPKKEKTSKKSKKNIKDKENTDNKDDNVIPSEAVKEEPITPALVDLTEVPVLQPLPEENNINLVENVENENNDLSSPLESFASTNETVEEPVLEQMPLVNDLSDSSAVENISSLDQEQVLTSEVNDNFTPGLPMDNLATETTDSNEFLTSETMPVIDSVINEELAEDENLQPVIIPDNVSEEGIEKVSESVNDELTKEEDIWKF